MTTRSERAAVSRGWTPAEALFVAAVAALLAVGGVVWLGAALAAVVSGSAPPGGLRDAVRALPQLVSDPADPGSAWRPPGDRWAGRPGPALYWAATATVVVAGGLLVGLVLCAWRRIGGRRRLGVEPVARFATRRELRPLLVRRPVPGRLVLGRWGRWLVATESRRWDPIPDRGVAGLVGWCSGRRRRGRGGDVSSVAIIGPTRSGKTAECAIPAVLDWVGPAVLLSVKRDLMDTTIHRRRGLGEVRVFDPGGLLARNTNPAVQISDEELARWSPLRNAHTATGAKKAGEALASWTPKAGVEGGMDFWTSQGQVLFTGLLGAAALSPRRSMREVAEWVFNMTMPSNSEVCEPVEILGAPHVRAAHREARDAAIMHLAAIWNKADDRLRSSVYATATTVITPWLDPAVIAATDLPRGATDSAKASADGILAGRDRDGEGETGAAGEWVDLEWLMDTRDGDRANTLYLLVDLDDYQRLAPVLAGLLSDLKAQAYEWESIDRPFPAPLLLLIDEAGNMPLRWLPEVSSTCAGLGIQLVTVWQSLAQITEAYGRRADVLLTNHATKLFFPAASDDSTLSYQTKIAGDEHVEHRSWSRDLDGDRRSVSGQDQREPLVPYVLARLPRFGRALMIHANLNPVQITGRRWWRDRRLAAMVPTNLDRALAPTGKGPWIPTRPAATPDGSPPADRAGRLARLRRLLRRRGDAR